jgi:hypothetical protein
VALKHAVGQLDRLGFDDLNILEAGLFDQV